MEPVFRPVEHRQGGQTVIAGVFALIVLGLSLISGFSAVGPKVALPRQQSGEQGMMTVQRAVELFVARNHRLPCPADGSVAQGTTTDGAENCALAPLNKGVVPWKALGLAESAATDGYNNRLGYAVTAALTSGTPYLTSVPSGDAVEVAAHCTTTPCTSATSPYAYVLISFGADGDGAYTLGGTRQPAPPTTAAEYNNTLASAFGGTGSFVTYSYCGSSTCTTTPTMAVTGPFDDSLAYQTSTQICHNINGSYGNTETNWSLCSPNAVTLNSYNAAPSGLDSAVALSGIAAQNGVSAASMANPLAFTGCTGNTCSNANGQLTLAANLGTVSVTGGTGGISTGNPNTTDYVDAIGGNNTHACTQCPYNAYNPNYLVPGQTLTYALNSSYSSFAFVDFLVNGGMTVQVTAYASLTPANPSTWTQVGQVEISNGPYTDNLHTAQTANPACLGPANETGWPETKTPQASVTFPSSPAWLKVLQPADTGSIPANNAPPNENVVPPPTGGIAWSGTPPPQLAQQWTPPTFGSEIGEDQYGYPVGVYDYQFANRKFTDTAGNAVLFNILSFSLLPYTDASNTTDAADANGSYKYGMIFEGLKVCPLYASETITIGGSATAGDIVTLTFANVAASGVSGAAGVTSYTVLAGDTPTSIAAGLAAAINANATLRSYGISAESFDPATNTFGSSITVVAETSTLVGSATAVTASTSPSATATETILLSSAAGVLAPSPGVAICDMRGFGPAPTYENVAANIFPGDEWWNPPVTETMDCSLQNGLSLE